MLIQKMREFLSLGEEGEPGGPEQRGATRRAVLLKASIYPIDVFCDAIIRNASRTGLMGEADSELAIGQTVHLSLDEMTYHSGVVRWTKGNQFGLDLNDALQLVALKNAEVEHGFRDGHGPRAGREVLNIAARLNTGRPPRPATVRNISATGLLLDTSPGLRAGQHLIVRLNGRTIYGRVQWSRDGRIGLKADTPISARALNAD
jgi:hypothetical protein